MEKASRNPVVAFDEAGNTGQDLLNKDQPIFTLASVHFSDEEATELIRILSSPQTQEAKFSILKRWPSNQQRVIDFLNSKLIEPEKVKITPFHKGFVVISKIVDLLIEPFARRAGSNVYERGLNMALSNLHYFCMPSLCGLDRFEEFQRRFVDMIRERSLSSIEGFYDYIPELMKACEDNKYSENLLHILMTKSFVGDEVLRNCDATTLDPAPSAFVLHCQVWGKQFNREFDAIHDDSKPIRHLRTIISFMMAKDEPTVEVGYDRRKSVFPLKASGVNFRSSKSLAQLQIADVFSGAYTYWAGSKIGLIVDKDFADSLEKSCLPGLQIGGVWPIPAFTPEELETTETGGSNTLEYLNQLIQRQSGKRKLV